MDVCISTSWAQYERFDKVDLRRLRNIHERMDIPVDLEYLDELPRLRAGKRSVIVSGSAVSALEEQRDPPDVSKQPARARC